MGHVFAFAELLVMELVAPDGCLCDAPGNGEEIQAKYQQYAIVEGVVHPFLQLPATHLVRCLQPFTWDITRQYYTLQLYNCEFVGKSCSRSRKV